MSDTSGSIWTQLWAASPRISAIVGALGVFYVALTFVSGPLRSQSQIDLEALKTEVSDLKSGQAVCTTRLDALPRASDFSGWESHLSRLDAVFDALRDRVTATEYAIKANQETQLKGRP